MRLPKSFNDITVKQYQDVYFLIQEKPKDDFQYLENWARVISILSNESYEKILELPGKELKIRIKQLNFILRPEVLQEKVKQYIAVKGKIYKAVTRAETLSTSQVFNIKGFQCLDKTLDINENTVVSMHELLATIYLPLTGKGFRYDSSKHRKVADNMLHAKMGDVYGTLFFYPILYEKLIYSMQESINEALPVLEEHFKEILESMPEKNLERDGVGK